MERPSTIKKISRIGFHYFPDTLHYREHDLKHWLPELKALNCAWLLLQATADRAIPEYFINGLIKGGIRPILHLNVPPETAGSEKVIDTLFHAYSRWGVRKVILFDRPNLRTAWTVKGWTQKNLVDQFLDYFMPLAKSAVRQGITPIFAPLHPGGDYWDTAFLKSAFEKIIKREEKLVTYLQLASYAWTWGKSLEWGIGGPERWSKSRPYSPPEEQDQRGFRNYDWVDKTAREVFGKSLPIHLLGAGLQIAPEETQEQSYFQNGYTDTVLSIARLCAGENVQDTNIPDAKLSPIPSNVLSTNFWILSADENGPYGVRSWFQQDKPNLPIVEGFRNWVRESREKEAKLHPVKTPSLENERKSSAFSPIHDARKSLNKNPSPATVNPVSQEKMSKFKRPIEHYLLLPIYEWGIADWHLDVIRPFVKKYRPTVGFSIKEAALATKVTVVGNTQSFPEAILDKLRATGCKVERISGDGTSIATQLASR